MLTTKKCIATTVLTAMLITFCFGSSSYAHSTENFWWGYRVKMSQRESENFASNLEDYADGTTRVMPLDALIPNTFVQVVLGLFGVALITKFNSVARDIRRYNGRNGIYMDIHFGYKGPLAPGGWTVHRR